MSGRVVNTRVPLLSCGSQFRLIRGGTGLGLTLLESTGGVIPTLLRLL